MRRRWNEINGYLAGRCAFLIGSGPSLEGFDFSRLDNEFTIAINHSIEHYPQAKACLFGDKIFLNKTTFDLSKFDGLIFASEKTDYCSRDERPNVFTFLDKRDEPGINAKCGLYHPTSSGLLALSLAIIMKARRVFLLGYDYRHLHGQRHFYGDMYEHHLRYPEDRVMKKAAKFEKFRPWASRIINCSEQSIIEVFQKKRLEEIFE